MITSTSSAGLGGLSLDVGMLPLLDTSLGADTRLEGGRLYFSNFNWGVVVDANGISVTRHADGEAFFAFDLAADPKQPPITFAGYSTLLLADGTKLTLHSAPWLPDSDQTRPDSLLIVSGDYGVQVGGIAPDSPGGLYFVETRDFGWLIDAVVPDGAVAFDNPDGPGLLGENPQNLWTALDVEGVDAGTVAAFGPPGAGALLADGQVAITFMGSFRGAPMFRMADPDDHSGTVFEQRRLSDQEAAVWRLCLARQKAGPLRGWIAREAAPADPGVHPSWGAPGCRVAPRRT